MSDFVKEVKCHYWHKLNGSITYEKKWELEHWILQSLPGLHVTYIEILSNPFLFAAFKVKQCEMGPGTKIVELLHSTSLENFELIKRENLDWRKVSRGRFGQGITFSFDADYADYFSTWYSGPRKVFIICDVLINKQRFVSKNQDLFPKGAADTYISNSGYVFVKFDDFTFYPKYAVHYIRPRRFII